MLFIVLLLFWFSDVQTENEWKKLTKPAKCCTKWTTNVHRYKMCRVNKKRMRKRDRERGRSLVAANGEEKKFRRPQSNVSKTEIEETWSSELRQRVTKLDVGFFFGLLVVHRDRSTVCSKITAHTKKKRTGPYDFSFMWMFFFFVNFLGKTLFRWLEFFISCVRISSISCYTILNYNYSVFSCSFPLPLFK